jgi:hypothetical protein
MSGVESKECYIYLTLLKPQFILVLGLLVIPILWPSLATSDTYITLNPSGDNYLRSDNKSQNMGTDTVLKISQSLLSRVVVRFDEADIADIIQGKHLISAELKFYITQNWGG